NVEVATPIHQATLAVDAAARLGAEDAPARSASPLGALSPELAPAPEVAPAPTAPATRSFAALSPAASAASPERPVPVRERATRGLASFGFGFGFGGA